MELDFSLVSEEDAYQCYNNSDGKPVHTNIEDEIQLLPKELNLTPEPGVNTEQLHRTKQ